MVHSLIQPHHVCLDGEAKRTIVKRLTAFTITSPLACLTTAPIVVSTSPTALTTTAPTTLTTPIIATIPCVVTPCIVGWLGSWIGSWIGSLHSAPMVGVVEIAHVITTAITNLLHIYMHCLTCPAAFPRTCTCVVLSSRIIVVR